MDTITIKEAFEESERTFSISIDKDGDFIFTIDDHEITIDVRKFNDALKFIKSF